MKFTVSLDRDEDGVWVAECPSIPGCVSQGSTREQALESVKEAIELCLRVRAKEALRSLLGNAGLSVAEFSTAMQRRR